ncbi:hypothetical protein KQI42_18875 [Tissierella sp. MSJ-40]|uniref:Uncharacterized protein n=1 Tax=Tissierella simiarum TaxID=2841534 RepID=A0ABS6EBE3_9FIRM|nr:hypothetical protein [Tissierella simiarum]MBU5440074.1 hypothetical protein [Tissierella simiarum]
MKIEELHFLIEEMDNRITKLEEIIKLERNEDLIEKIDGIEDFLIRRTRGYYLREKKK